MNVLIVGYNGEISARVGNGLKHAGHGADVAADCIDALNKARERPYGMVVIDHIPPGRDGSELVAALTGDDSPPTQFFLTSAFSAATSLDGVEAGGVDCYLEHPLDQSRIHDWIRGSGLHSPASS